MELVRAQKEVEIVIRENKWKELDFPENKILNIDIGDEKQTGYYFSSSHKNELDIESYISVYMFIVEDKFVRIVGNFPEEFLTAHVKKGLPELTVPGESLFMAKLRQQNR